jgi:hypothetical protein
MASYLLERIPDNFFTTIQECRGLDMKADQVCNRTKVFTVGLIAMASIFGRPFVANGANNSGLSTAITLQRPTSNAPVATASGAVFISKTTVGQTFSVIVKNIALNVPADGLAVFLNVPGNNTNFYLVNTLNGGGTNGTWKLDMRGSPSAPAQLGVPDVTNLVGRIVRISDTATNLYLETIIQPFVPSLSALSYHRRVLLQRPNPAPSPNATGEIRVKLNGPKGSSVFEVRARNLDGGNSYCSWLLPFFGAPGSGDCPKTPNLVNGRAVFKADTGKGEQLAENAVESGDVRIDTLSGVVVEIRDQFGVTHLQGIIP